MAITALSPSGALPLGITELKAQLTELQIQLGTGKKALSYGGLGSSASLSLGFRTQISEIEGFRSTIDTVSLRLTMVDSSLQRVQEIADETRGSLLNASYLPGSDLKTTTQYGAEAHLSELVALYNSNVSGHHLFAGRAADKPPVVSDQLLLNGEPGKAGFSQALEERKLADLGTGGLGRLTLPVPVAADVTLSEDGAGHPFGFKLTSVTNGLTGTTVTGPTGSPASLQVSFTATLPLEGETIAVGVTLPDGTSTQIELAATLTSPPGPGEFTIGADENATAANFQTALAAEIVEVGKTELAAASAIRAADDFFDYDATNPPQRVDGPPFESATALRNATQADTVFWYQGDLVVQARSSAIAKVDENLSVQYGARADEQPLREVIKQVALLAAERFDGTVATDADRYAALSERMIDALSPDSGAPIVRDMIVELAHKHVIIDKADSRHNEDLAFAKNGLGDVEGVDLDDVGVRILRLQTQLQASFETTSILSRLTIVNFI